MKTYKIKVDLPGHTDEVYCVDFVADKVVSGGRDKTLKMCVCFFFFFDSFVIFLSFRVLILLVDGKIRNLSRRVFFWLQIILKLK